MRFRRLSFFHRFAFATFLLLCIILFWRHTSTSDKTVLSATSAIQSNPSTIENETHEESTAVQEPVPTLEPNVTIVVASRARDETSWLHDNFPRWLKRIYVTDDSNAQLHVPANKGREGMVYLEYIIDNYDNLPEVMVFHHALRYQWHNDDPLCDGGRVLSRLRIPYVRTQGYVNLRCVWTLGCPSEIRPLAEEGAPLPGADPSSRSAGHYYKHAFEQFLPGSVVPEVVGATCCAQFAVTAETVRARSKQQYEKYRKWLLETPVEDGLSGRIMEYSWHIIFGKDPVHCPATKDCYCNVFGLCDLQCESEGTCQSQYTLPSYSTLPKGWPDYDWEGRWQNATAM